MAKRPRRWLRLLVVFGVAFVALFGGARLARHATSAPEALGRVQRERNLFTDLYGARAGGGVILFDTGVDPAGGALDRLLATLGATRADVRDVFLTHGHFDHVAASPLCTHAKLRVGAPDVEFLAQRATMVAPVAGKLLHMLFPVPPVYATDPLVGRTEIRVGEDEVLAIPTPGHTAGSYVFVFDKMMFAGDTLVIDGDRLGFAMPSFAIDPPGNRRSVAALAAALSGVDVQTICTGHMGCTPPGRGAAMLAALLERAREEK